MAQTNINQMLIRWRVLNSSYLGRIVFSFFLSVVSTAWLQRHQSGRYPERASGAIPGCGNSNPHWRRFDAHHVWEWRVASGEAAGPGTQIPAEILDFILPKFTRPALFSLLKRETPKPRIWGYKMGEQAWKPRLQLPAFDLWVTQQVGMLFSLLKGRW